VNARELQQLQELPFCAYLTSPVYGWAELCERTFGDVPAQISFEWNTPRHTNG